MVKLHRHLIAAVIAGLKEIFHEGKPADVVVAHALHSHPKWGSRDRRQFAEQVYEIVRHYRYACYLAGSEELDHVWAAWLMAREGTALPEEFTVGLEFYEIMDRANAEVPVGIRESIPEWMDVMCQAAYGAEWEGLAKKLNEPAEVYLRVNRLRASVAEVANRLKGEGVETLPVEGAPDALQLAVRKPLQNSPTWRAGWCEIQDAGSQLIAPFLDPAPNQIVIDACAGAGGKTLHLAALMRNRGRLISMDVSEAKLAELENRNRRNGVLIGESHSIEPETLKQFEGIADRLLLDVPCSGTGVLRRKPDTKWRLTAAEVERLIKLQASILQDYSAMVKPGGALVYATCSILPQENSEQIQRFLANNGTTWELAAEQLLRPDTHNWDGFYMAKLIRKK